MHLSLSVWEVPSTWPFLEWFGNTYDVVVPMPMMVKTVLLTLSLCERWCWEAIVLWLWVSLLLAQCVAHSWEAIVCRSKWCVVLLTVLLTVEKQLFVAHILLLKMMCCVSHSVAHSWEAIVCCSHFVAQNDVLCFSQWCSQLRRNCGWVCCSQVKPTALSIKQSSAAFYKSTLELVLHYKSSLHYSLVVALFYARACCTSILQSTVVHCCSSDHCSDVQFRQFHFFSSQHSHF